MYLYYTEMMQAIDLVKEDQRLTGVEFSKKSAPGAAVKMPAPAPPPAVDGRGQDAARGRAGLQLARTGQEPRALPEDAGADR